MAHAPACPSQAGVALEAQDGKAASQEPGLAMDCRWPCFASHLPPEIPWPAPRGVQARGCRQVFGLVDAEGFALPLARRFPGPGPSAKDGFVSTYRCGAVPAWRERVTGFPFDPLACGPPEPTATT